MGGGRKYYHYGDFIWFRRALAPIELDLVFVGNCHGNSDGGEKFMLTFLINKKWNQVGNIKIAIDNLGRVYVFLMLALTVYFTAKETFPE